MLLRQRGRELCNDVHTGLDTHLQIFDGMAFGIMEGEISVGGV